MYNKNELTKKEFELLLKKAAQPLPEPFQKHALEVGETSESQASGDCTRKNIHTSKTGDI